MLLSLAKTSLLLPGLAACSQADPMVQPGTSAADAPNELSDAPSTQPAPERPADIRAADLGSLEWLYSFNGIDLPVSVQLIDGAAAEGSGAELTSYALDEVVYGDVDGDGDEDAVARINRSNDMAFEGLWYVWLAEGPDVVQLKYPIAQTGRCATYVESVVIGDGVVELTEYLRIPGLDDMIPCSDPGTGLQKRSVTVHAEGPDAWPVQTAPVPAWGGLCPGPRWPDTAPGLVDLWAAPSAGAPVAATAAPDGGAVFELLDAPLMQHDGWALLGFRLFGVETDAGGADLACAWGAAA
ncbi:hypothetical protein ART_1204 [Arthrobacter sp. PAMC 25486]|nr:hypothetical protein ART_1204 [Arthrobacter sp. PAMC 25486]